MAAAQRLSAAVESSTLRYHLERRLAVGGMAELFAARARGAGGFDKRVAIKHLRPELSGDPDLWQAFLDEARIGSLLEHPNLPQVFDIGVGAYGHFLVMEYVDGLDLETLMQRLAPGGERLPLAHALHIVAAVADALHYAHELRDADGTPLELIHRDVSPANVIVSVHGDVKLVDFGVAKSSLSSTRTRFGFIKGKAPYMSPEQCLQQPLDRRSDVFSLGVVLYELVSGRELFRTEPDDNAAMQRVIAGDIPPLRGRGGDDDGLDAELIAVVERALAIDPDARFATAEEMRRAVDALPRPPRAGGRRELGSLIALVRDGDVTATDTPAAPDDPTVITPLNGSDTIVAPVVAALPPPEDATVPYGPRERELAVAEGLSQHPRGRTLPLRRTEVLPLTGATAVLRHDERPTARTRRAAPTDVTGATGAAVAAVLAVLALAALLWGVL